MRWRTNAEKQSVGSPLVRTNAHVCIFCVQRMCVLTHTLLCMNMCVLYSMRESARSAFINDDFACSIDGAHK